MKPARVLCFFLVLSVLVPSCQKAKPALPAGTAQAARGLERGRTYRVFIVRDMDQEYSQAIESGFRERLDGILSEAGASAAYESFCDELDPAKADNIRARIEAEKPDIACMVNHPDAFADCSITQKLTGPDYRFVSENAIAVESGTISSLERPGGNVSGVGVFIRQNSSLKLLKRVAPGIKRIFSYSWIKMGRLNAWWKAELERACREEGFELQEFRQIRTIQEELAILEDFTGEHPGTALMGCVSAFENADGTPTDGSETLPYYQDKIRVPDIAYEDIAMKFGALMGACVIWKDLGAQLADKAGLILGGRNPGDIPWDYPRSYNIVINLKTAAWLGIDIPKDVLEASYRVYTDYDGAFMGKGD
jgi:putative ABC transport system substrate-binding protein